MRYFIIPFIFSIILQVDAQNLVDFPEEGFRQGVIYASNFIDPTTKRSIRYERDTIMCNKKYAMYCLEDFQDGAVYNCKNDKFRHFTRYDNGRVYAVLFNCSNQETLKYDFNLNLNDTFLIEYSWSFKDRSVVDSVGAVMLNDGKIRKYIRLKSLNNKKNVYEWVDGIGDIRHGLFYESDFEGGITLLICQKNYNDILFQNYHPEYTCDELLENLTVQTNNTENSEFNIYPNPAKKFISISNYPQKINEILIYDMLGILVLKQNVLEKNLKSIDVSALNAGIYFLYLPELNYKYKLTIAK